MILKKLYDDYGFSIETILIKEYRRLNLSMNELTIIIALLDIYKKRRTFSISAISRRVSFNKNEIASLVEQLLDKGFMTITLDQKDGKEREVFHLSPIFERVEKMLEEDVLEKQRSVVENKVASTIKIFEQGLGRPLKSYELENIRVWYDQKTYTHEQIQTAIEAAGGNMSIKYVERILMQQIIPHKEIDSELDKALDSVFKKIK